MHKSYPRNIPYVLHQRIDADEVLYVGFYVEKDVPLDILFERYDTSSVACYICAYGIFRDQDQV